MQREVPEILGRVLSQGTLQDDIVAFVGLRLLGPNSTTLIRAFIVHVFLTLH